MIRLERLGIAHLEPILERQDTALAREIIGRPWDREGLEEFLGRSGRWREDGPVQELAALEEPAGRMVGGGGLHRLAPGLARGQAALTYWLFSDVRGRGLGVPLAEALVERARAMAGVREAVLLIAPENTASRAVAGALEARPTDELVPHPADGARRAERWVLDLRTG